MDLSEAFQVSSFQNNLAVVLGIIGIIWYFVCLISVGRSPTQTPSPYRQFESLSITTISVSLATFIGSLLGKVKVEDQIATQSPTVTANPSVQDSLDISSLQWASVIAYIASLAIAMYYWRRKGAGTDAAVATLAKSLLGLVGGALSILFKT